MIGRDDLLVVLEHVARLGESKVQRFQERLSEPYPFDALETCESVFEAAAEAHVARIAIRTLTSDDSNATVESVLEYAMGRTMHNARYPRHSSSVTSNLATQYVTSAWARLVGTIKDDGVGGF